MSKGYTCGLERTTAPHFTPNRGCACLRFAHAVTGAHLVQIGASSKSSQGTSTLILLHQTSHREGRVSAIGVRRRHGQAMGGDEPRIRTRKISRWMRRR